MTTYVLHGGQTSNNSPATMRFFDQFSQLVPKRQIRYLMCYWARPEKEWEERLTQDKKKIIGQTNKKTLFEIVKNPMDLYQKLPEADGLYVAGGDAEPIEKYYGELSDLKTGLEGKVFLGSSMGAFMASTAYVLSPDSQDEQSVHQGLGLVPFKTLVHWNIETKKEIKLDLLKNNDPKTPIITLNEGEFVTIYR